jgi:DNA cross-link repair 1B protein
MLHEKFNVNPDLIVVLEEDKTHNIPLDMNSRKVTMQVTLIDANHCPGACMFLLEGYFGTILHTGDFRFDPLILQHDALRNKKIDHLYLDDTFLDPIYDFPSRVCLLIQTN